MNSTELEQALTARAHTMNFSATSAFELRVMNKSGFDILLWHTSHSVLLGRMKEFVGSDDTIGFVISLGAARHRVYNKTADTMVEVTRQSNFSERQTFDDEFCADCRDRAVAILGQGAQPFGYSCKFKGAAMAPEANYRAMRDAMVTDVEAAAHCLAIAHVGGRTILYVDMLRAPAHVQDLFLDTLAARSRDALICPASMVTEMAFASIDYRKHDICEWIASNYHAEDIVSIDVSMRLRLLSWDDQFDLRLMAASVLAPHVVFRERDKDSDVCPPESLDEGAKICFRETEFSLPPERA